MMNDAINSVLNTSEMYPHIILNVILEFVPYLWWMLGNETFSRILLFNQMFWKSCTIK